ncbi:hypothetical protein [Acidithiobacillus sulfurivorans]|uniref:Uncharacterized protein n=1 Tax=Acidithiobacillus sulfurivorans TaxID=1958756 RepID=A0ABS5ZWG4_9PROT|nr:hypothetical protein [Acidithiobacillus sulfurivorans]MBU2759520.1 hypothetical protein [Acidithiobacillus sulfurivorans]
MEAMPDFLTVKQFVAKHPAFSMGGMRSALYWQQDALEEAGAMTRMGRRILIDEQKFMKLVQSGGLRTVRGVA